MASVSSLPPFPQEGRNSEETIRNLKDTVIRLRKELEFLLGNLDEDNVIRAKSVVTDWVYAGNIQANQIDTTNAKIQAAQIESLIVGGNVSMGPNASISWEQVTGTEQIPLRSDLTWDNVLDKPTNLLTQAQLQAALTDYVTTGNMTDALADTLNTGNFSTIITRDYIASMNLVVGNEILMGANASISWNNVDSKPTFSTVATSGNYSDLSGTPSIPSQYTDTQALNAWKNSGYATYINANGVYSGSFNGGMFNINPSSDPALESGITIGGWYDNGWAGEALRIKYDKTGHNGYPGTVFESMAGVAAVFNTNVAFNDVVYFQNPMTYFNGTVDFTNANVTGLSVIAKFG